MKIPAIKNLLTTYTAEEISIAYQEWIANSSLTISVEGEDEGEKLTHLYAAVWINKHADENFVTISDSLRAYTTMVRSSLH